MVVKIASYNDGASNYNAEVEEAEWTDYRIIARLNECAEAVITIADPTGSIMRKYNVDANDVFIGPGRLTIEKPAGTDIFDGRILKARFDSGSATVQLHCKDWMSQLADPIITKDMREDLDGNGLRESSLLADGTSDLIYPVYTTGANYYLFDDAMDWSADEWNNKYVVFPNSMLGSITVSTGAYTETVTPTAAPMTVDLPTNGVKHTWKPTGGGMHHMSDTADWAVEYTFRVYTNQSAFYSSGPTAATFNLIYKLRESSAVGVIEYYNYTDAAYVKLADLTVAATATDVLSGSFSVPSVGLAHMLDGSGLAKIRFSLKKNTSYALLDLYYLFLDIDFETTVYPSAVLIDDTIRANTAVHGAVADDGGAETDETDEAGDAVASDMTLMPAVPVVGDAYLFGFDVKTEGISINVETDADGIYTITWKYSQGGDVWAALSDVVDQTYGFLAPGTNTVRWTVPGDWATDTVGLISGLYWVKAELTALTNMAPIPVGTQAWMLRGHKLKVGTDLTLANADTGFWNSCPYSIVQPIYKHIDTAEGGTLVSDYDLLVPLTAAAGVEHTSGFSTRRYENHTPQAILQDLANIDKVAFYMTLGTTALTWKSTFNDGAPDAMTDASVIRWGGEYSFLEVRNGYIIYGPKINNVLMRLDTKDIAGGDPGADSKSTYGVTRTAVVKNAGVNSEYEMTTLGSAIVERDEDVLLFLECDIAGLSALRLGDEVSITSTIMGLTAAKYVITYWEYSYSANITKLRLHPRLSTKGFVQHKLFGDTIRRLATDTEQLAADVSYIPSETST